MNLYAVGKIVGCFGINGFIKIQPTTHSLERLKLIRDIFIGLSFDKVKPAIIEVVIIDRDPVLMKFQGVNDRTSAGYLINQYLFVDEKDVKKPVKGSFFIHDIIGCEVSTEDGKYAGKIVDVYRLPAQDVWVIEKDGKRFLIPAVKEFIKVVDTDKRKIIIHVIDGLMEE